MEKQRLSEVTMKKSFFLLTATALVAMFSFSACSDDKDDPPLKACDLSETLFVCVEAEGPSYSDVSELVEYCELVGGKAKSGCPKADLTCPYPTDEDGDKQTDYYYGLAALGMTGECPDEPIEF
jgi:hypothetical protein